MLRRRFARNLLDRSQDQASWRRNREVPTYTLSHPHLERLDRAIDQIVGI